MNTVQAAKTRTRQPHPIDRISQARRHLHAVSLLIDYAIEKDEIGEDGLSPERLCDAVSAVLAFSEEINVGVRDLMDNFYVKRVQS